MSYETLESPIELTDDELDVVAAGDQNGVFVQDINVNVGIGDNKGQFTDA
jgi:hypothetical protein